MALKLKTRSELQVPTSNMTNVLAIPYIPLFEAFPIVLSISHLFSNNETHSIFFGNQYLVHELIIQNQSLVKIHSPHFGIKLAFESFYFS